MRFHLLSGGPGYESRIWSHQWVLSDGAWFSSEGVAVWAYHISPALWGTSGSNIGHIGVIAHETGHFLGLPDLYDYDYSGSGVGSWSLMANSWGFDGSQRYPPMLDPFCKIGLGWASSTTVLSDDCAANALLPAIKTLNPSYTHHEYYQITHGFPTTTEYLLIENRQALGFDALIPQEGILIWHIDTLKDQTDEGYPGQAGWPDNGRHYKVALLQADGLYQLEQGSNSGDAGDVYHGSGVTSIGPGPYTYPNTDTYQFGTILPTFVTINGIASGGGDVMQFGYEDGCCSESELRVELELLTDAFSTIDNNFTLISQTTGDTIWYEG